MDSGGEQAVPRRGDLLRRRRPGEAGDQPWHIPARRFAAATKVAVEQIIAYPASRPRLDRDVVDQRRRPVTGGTHAQALAALEEAEQPRDDVITAEYLTACVRRLIEGADAIVLTEVVTNSKAVSERLRPGVPGSVLHHGGGSLGWSGGAALGARSRRRRTRGLPRRRRLVPVQLARLCLLGAAPVRRPVADGHLRQPRLARAQVLHPAACTRPGLRQPPTTSTCPSTRRWTCPAWRWRQAPASARRSPTRRAPRVLKEALAAVHAGRSAVVTVHLPPV